MVWGQIFFIYNQPYITYIVGDENFISSPDCCKYLCIVNDKHVIKTFLAFYNLDLLQGCRTVEHDVN